MDGPAHVMWPENLRCVVRMMCVSGGWSVRLRASSFEMRSLQHEYFQVFIVEQNLVGIDAASVLCPPNGYHALNTGIDQQATAVSRC